jgi:hypothetical protein
MSFGIAQDQELDLNERLRMETGWGDVASGLSKVLFGYGVLFLGTAIGFGLVAMGMWGMGVIQEGAKKVAKPSNEALWQLYLGLGILSVIGLISYCIIVGGQFRCMMGAAERHGCRWFMFVCIACLFLGPAFEFASGAASWQSVSELRKNPSKMTEFQLNPLGQWLQLIGFGISMLYPLAFCLFLRAVAVCLRASSHVMLVNVFLVIGGGVVAATGLALVEYRPGAKPMPQEHALMLGLAWGVMLLLYVALIAVMRVCIHTVLGQVKSPLDV